MEVLTRRNTDKKSDAKECGLVRGLFKPVITFGGTFDIYKY